MSKRYDEIVQPWNNHISYGKASVDQCFVALCVCVCVCVCLCVSVCVREREGDRDRDRQTERQRQTDRQRQSTIELLVSEQVHRCFDFLLSNRSLTLCGWNTSGC